jgi:hypothetical protein
LRGIALTRILGPMAEPLVERREVEALLFNVADIAATLKVIESLLTEEGDDEEEEDDEG